MRALGHKDLAVRTLGDGSQQPITRDDNTRLQVMSHVRQNIEQVPGELSASREGFERTGELQPVDAAALLAALQKTYAMAEEHATHRGGSVTAPASEEITFF